GREQDRGPARDRHHGRRDGAEPDRGRPGGPRLEPLDREGRAARRRRGDGRREPHGGRPRRGLSADHAGRHGRHRGGRRGRRAPGARRGRRLAPDEHGRGEGQRDARPPGRRERRRLRGRAGAWHEGTGGAGAAGRAGLGSRGCPREVRARLRGRRGQDGVARRCGGGQPPQARRQQLDSGPPRRPRRDHRVRPRDQRRPAEVPGDDRERAIRPPLRADKGRHDDRRRVPDELLRAARPQGRRPGPRSRRSQGARHGGGLGRRGPLRRGDRGRPRRRGHGRRLRGREAEQL
ncbi:MAG: 3-hydroxyisobutyrate dehydrogenase family protein, partial [uncultured Rubrobacteraceae bacterium]